VIAPGGWAPALVLRQGDDPAAVRDEVRELMSQRRFSYEPSLLERFGNWLSELFDLPSVGAPGAFGGGAGAWVAWLLIVLALAAIVVVVVLAVRNRTRRRDEDEGPATSEELEHRRRASEWGDDAERHEREGRWKEAIRARYRELVRTLVDRRQLGDVPGRTTGELRRDLALTTPAAGEAFDAACVTFELAWYADVVTDEASLRRLRAAAAEVLAAPVEDRFDGPLDGPRSGTASVEDVVAVAVGSER
jgi:hypothetical protein